MLTYKRRKGVCGESVVVGLNWEWLEKESLSFIMEMMT